MTSRPITMMAVVVIVAACGGQATTASTTSPDAATAASTTATTAAITSPNETKDAVVDFFVNISNILGEALNRQIACVEEHNPSEVDNGFTREGEEATEPEPVEHDPDYYQRLVQDCLVAVEETATESLANLAAPAVANDALLSYVVARRTWVAVTAVLANEAASEQDVEDLFIDDDVVSAGAAVGEACRALNSLAASFGLTVTLPCPGTDESTIADGVTATIDANGWLVDPPGALDDGTGVGLVLVNNDSVPHQPVVVTLFSGGPSQLPVLGGGVDLSRSGVVADAAAPDGHGFFGLTWPEPSGEGWNGPVPELAPGASLRVPLRSGRYVIFDQVAGAYEAGSFEILVISSLPEIEETYVARANAAETCEQLAEVIVTMYEAYADEVSLMSAETFARSPLSMIDDLRFGASLARSSALGCDGSEVSAAVNARFCTRTPAEGSAEQEVVNAVCGV